MQEERKRILQLVESGVISASGSVGDLTVNDSRAFYFACVYEPEYLAFDPGNGNGIEGSYDTVGSMFDYGGQNGISRVEIDAGFYEDNNHEVSIVFPSDSQLGTEMSIVSGDDLKYVIPKEKAYNYKLKGWYNIATGDCQDCFDCGDNYCYCDEDDCDCHCEYDD